MSMSMKRSSFYAISYSIRPSVSCGAEWTCSVSSNRLTVTFQGMADGLKMSDPNGNRYNAKFDGKNYPLEGYPGNTMVALK